jgi:enoyl-CoA hydratase/carnithine racemase
MADPTVLVERRGRVATVILNRPEVRNAFSSVEHCETFVAALKGLERDPEVAVVIVTGAGSAFSAGGDVKDMQARTGFAAGNHLEMRDRYRHGVQQLTGTLYELELPTIAAVNGPAVGLGCDIACCCDVRIASESARFAESFIKLGLVPGDGGTYFLQRIVGYPKAAELSLTGDLIDAAEALRIGLVTSVVPAGDLRAAADALADRIAANPPRSVRLTKRLLREGERATLSAVFELSAAFQAIVQHSDDHREAVDAMLAKRPPSYQGR